MGTADLDDTHGTILIVEDEVLIAMSEKKTLESHGYRVVTVNSGEHALKAVDTSEIDLQVNVTIPSPHDTSGTMLVAINDITDLKTYQKSLLRDRHYLNQLVETVPTGIVRLNGEGEIVLANRQAELILGLSRSEIETRTYNDPAWEITDFDGGTFPDSKLPFVQVQSTGKPAVDVRHAIEWPDGERKLLSINAAPLFDTDGAFSGRVATFEDITERIRKEEHLEALNAEKDFLMKELNHRVKNNLMMISSLISLRESSEEGAVDLSDLMHQVDAVRIVHEKLYLSEDILNVDLEEYLVQLLDTVFSFSDTEVWTRINVEHITLPTKTAMAVGLIVNEIATNAMKHGFPMIDDPCFEITLRREAERGLCLLTLTNNGAPFPDGITLDNPDTLGLRLITSLVEQLAGSLELQRAPHPRFTIRFPIVQNDG